MQKDFDYKLCTLSAQQLGRNRFRRSECAALQWNAGPDRVLVDGAGRSRRILPHRTARFISRRRRVCSAHCRRERICRSRMDRRTVPVADSVDRYASPIRRSALTLLAKAQYDEARAAFRVSPMPIPRTT
jgi:hypothetical protein